MLESLDMSKTLSSAKYEEELMRLQLELVKAQRTLVDRQVGVVLVFEGMDAAGKGGAIKRVTSKLDPRGFEVHPIGPPEEHERRYHYLRRFWILMPAHGRIGIFDRSWYGRVLVERVEQLTPEDAWQRAYREINEFEKQISDDDTVIVKFWMHVTKDEQLVRFHDRENDPYRRWKITDADWRNRKKWKEYVAAAEEMFVRTSTPHAPWNVVPGNDKEYARIFVLRTILETIDAALARSGFGHASGNSGDIPAAGARSLLEANS